MTASFQKKGRYSSYAPAAEFPHPKLEPEIFIILHRVLACALEILSTDAQPLATMHEDAITSALERVIENRLRQTGEVYGFCIPLFERVTRQHECDNFDGSLQRERPDLFFGIRPDDSFRTRIQSDQWGVFAECKPVDAEHYAGSDYCEGGLARFLRGGYAWAMQDALMVAYARDRRSIASHLIPAMKSRAHLHIQKNVASLPGGACALGGYHEDLHVSEHSRFFEWTDGRGPACPITVYHSWHDCGNRFTPQPPAGTNQE